MGGDQDRSQLPLPGVPPEAPSPLLAAEARFRALFDAAPVAMSLIDIASLRLVAFNDRACEELGYSRQEFAGLSLPDLWATDREPRSAILSIDAGPTAPFEIQLRARSGEVRTMLVSATRMRIEGQDLFCTARIDTTEARAREREHKRTIEQRSAILDALPANVALLDGNGRIVAVNAAWRRFAASGGLAPNSPSTDIGANYLAACVPAALAGDAAARGTAQGLTAILEGRLDSYELVYPCDLPDGTERWFRLLAASLDHSDLGAGLVIMHVNITEQVISRRAIEERDARLNELQAELLHVSRLGDAGMMVSALAHELNQPLTSTLSALQAARRGLAESPAADEAAALAREAVDLAAEQALRAGRIVRKLREFVARGKTSRRAERVTQLVEDAAMLALAGTRHGPVQVGFALDPSCPPALCDRVQIQQVLFNLLRNAIEAMSEAEQQDRPQNLLVRSSRSAGGDLIEIAVADSGPGLAPEAALRLFQPFVTTKPAGMGIGLSLCRAIVEAHGGRIWAEANPGGGAVLRFTLPVAMPEPAFAGGADGPG